MPIELLPSLLLTILAVGYTPGPANIYALSCALRIGRKRAVKAWLGLVCGFLTTATCTALIVHFAGMAFGRYVVYIKYAGAAYLLYLAWRMLHSSISAQEERESRFGVSFLTGYIIQLCNAKNILFQLTVFSTYVLPYSDRLADMFAVLGVMLLGGPLASLLWMTAGLALKPHLVRWQRTVNIVMAVTLALCAVMIALI